MFTCELCGKELKNKGGYAAHKRLKHSVQDVEPPVVTIDVGPVTVGDDRPAVIPEWNELVANIKVTSVGREITMLRPICDSCQRPKRTLYQWWLKCQHNPYVQVVPVTTKVTRYEDLGDGRKKVTGIDEIEHYEERPNRVQVSAWRRINSGVLVERKMRRAGFIMPDQLRTPTYPNGIANTCEYRDCFVQEGLIQTRWGVFCRTLEAQLVGHDARMDGGGGALEIGDTPQSQEKQRMQLEAVPL